MRILWTVSAENFKHFGMCGTELRLTAVENYTVRDI